MAMLTNPQFLTRYDARRVGQFVLDTTPSTAASAADLADPTTAAGGVLATLIGDAEDLVLAAAQVGDRYTADDIRTLAAAPADANGHPPPGQRLLYRLLADLAFGLAVKRRSPNADDLAKVAPAYYEASRFLDLVRGGERVFGGVTGVPEAGLPGTASMTPRPLTEPPRMSQNVLVFGLLNGDGRNWC